MWQQFTAAAQRALLQASGWFNRTNSDEMDTESLLVGLLGEPESRAASMLASLGIDLSAVLGRWPALKEISDPLMEGAVRKPFSRDVELSLELAHQRLAMLPQPLEFATEHILLGLADADHEVAVWLRQRGLDPDVLEAEICRLYGYKAAGDEGPPVSDEEPAVSDEGHGMEDEGTTMANRGWRMLDLTSTIRLPTSALRALDAAANRAREGLRVVEDYVRFGLDDPHLTALCKQLRHDLTAALDRISLEQRLAARETLTDVGTGLSTTSEESRADLAAVLAANFARVQESLRSLEEFGKLVEVAVAEVFKQLRYRTYTLQRAVEITRGSIARLAGIRLCVLLDGRPSIGEFEQIAGELLDAGTEMVQLRDKQLSDRELLARARLLRSLTQGKALLIVNDRPDLAAAAGANGVHLGQDDSAVKDARSLLGPEALIGVSTHSIQQARQAVLDGANYIGVGPTFPSGTKHFEKFPGVELLRHVAAEIRLPAFAIGGINRDNLAEVLAAGFTRIAVSGAVTSAADPIGTVKGLLGRLAGNGGFT